MPDVVMPRLSDSMEEGTVLKWLKAVGDEVAVGDELVEIETDKANMVYEADTAGTLVEILAEEGATLPIGEVIARVGDASGISSNGGGGAAVATDGGAAPAGTPSTAAAQPPSPSAAQAPPPSPGAAGAPAAPVPASDGGRVKASPIARRIAKERNIDLRALAGSGPGGRIVKADVERAAGAAGADVGGRPGGAPVAVSGSGVSDAGSATPGRPPAVAPGGAVEPAAPTAGASEKPETAKGQIQVVELTKLQQTVARRMAESKATAPHFYLQAEIDMTEAVRARTSLKQSQAAPGREAGEAAPSLVPTYNDMVVKACALALREFPRANGAYRDGRVELYSRVNVGVAVAAQDALVVPTIFDADLKGLRRIAEESRALASRVRDGSITPPELSGGTFTVSNLGMYGVSNFGAVINTPQAGILAVGELLTKPAVLADGTIGPRELMGVTLACDHRILYGADGALFLKRVRELLTEPIGLAL